MKRVALVTNELRRPASELACSILLAGFKGRIDAEFEVLSYSQLASWRGDMALLMGYDSKPDAVKTEASTTLVGVIDPRPRQNLDLSSIDFLLVNGFESWQVWRSCGVSIEYFYLCETRVSEKRALASADHHRSFRIGYLGNAVHLRRLKQNVAEALGKLALETELSFRLFVSGQVAESDWRWLPRLPEIYRVGIDSIDDFMNGVDLGVVPQLKPSSILDRVHTKLSQLGPDRDNTVNVSFKPTTNPGRLLSFAQFGVPLISEATPSSSFLLGDKYRDFLVLDPSGWDSAFRYALANREGLQTYGDYLSHTFEMHASPTVQVDRILRFL